MSLPKAVMEGEQAANAAIEASKNGNTGNAPTPDQDNPVTNETPAQQTSTGDADYKHKYEVLQGKFNKLASDLKTLQQREPQQPDPASIERDPRFVQMQQQIAQLQQQNSQLMQALESQPTPEESVELDPYLVEEYGEEFAKAVAESAAKQTKAAMKQFEQKFGHQIEETQKRVSSVTTHNTMATLRAMLDKANVNFELVNNDPDFHAYLAQVEPYSGEQRQILMQNAFNAGDVARTARFFTDFVKQQNRPDANHPLADHVDPSTNVTMQDTGTQRPVFDEGAWARLHDQFRRGQITEADFQKREQQLFSALG